MASHAHAEHTPRHHPAPVVRKIPSHAHDLTEGAVWRRLLGVLLPLLFALALLAATACTTLVAVWLEAPAACEAMLRVTTLTLLAEVLALAFGVGCSMAVGHAFGARDGERLSDGVHTAVALALVCGVVLSVGGLLGAEPLLRLLQPDAPLPEGTLLLAYPQLAGLAPTFAYACGLTLQWAVGDTFTPLRTTATAFLVNAGFNALLLGYLHLDPWVGAASTLGATLLGCLLTFRALGKAPRNWRVSLGRIRIVGSLAHDMLMCALPLMVQVVALFAAELAARPLRTTFGVQMLQAWSLAAGIGAPVWLLTGALALALSVFAAQNFGMARYDRMQGGLLAALWLGLLLVGGLEAVLCILARTLAQPFVSSLSDATLVATIACMTIPFYALGSCADAIASAIRGAGESLRPAAIIIGGVCLLRTILLMTVVPVHHSILALVAVYPLTWGATVIALLVYYRHGRWLTRTLRRARRTRARHLHER